MKNIIKVLLLFLLIPSCVGKMEEHESTRIAGVWAVVDEYNMSSRFFAFAQGYLTEYKSLREYYLFNGILWGVRSNADPNGDKYKYSLHDGVLHYYNHYNEVKTSLKLEDGVMMIGDQVCVPVNGVKSGYYSKIILSSSNKTAFMSDDKVVEWEYEIQNPVPGLELVVEDAPIWCGGPEGVRVQENKISFVITPKMETVKGEFVFSYPSAADVVVQVRQGDVDVLLDESSAYYRYNSSSGSFGYTVVNGRTGIVTEAKADAYWITNIKNDGKRISFSIAKNTMNVARTGRITVSYDDISADYVITQSASDGYGYWVGQWNLVGANGVTQKVVFLDDGKNESYYMTGYEGLPDDCAVLVDMNAQRQVWEIRTQVVGKVDLGDGEEKDLWFLGGNTFGPVYTQEGASVCTCWKSSDSYNKVSSSGAGIDFMFFCADMGGEWQYVTDVHKSGYPTFPITIKWAGK